MPVTGTSVATQALAGLISNMPTVTAATRSDSTLGIPVHNPMAKMMTYCSKAWVSVVTTTIVSNTYTGVAAGSAVAAPALITFPAAYAAGAQLITTLGWIGPSAPFIANALTKDIALATALQAQYVSGPAPGGGVGTGFILPNNQVPLLTTAGLFITALQANFMSEGLFSKSDLKLVLTPQIVSLIGAVGGVYATMFSSLIVKGAIVYSGAAAPTALSVPVVPGKII